MNDGYLILDNFYTRREMDDFKDTLWQVVRANARRAGIPAVELDETVTALERIDHAYIADIYDTIAQTPAFWRLAAKPELERVINDFLPGPFYLFTNRCRIDMPGDTRRTYGWHQEVFYTIPQSNFVQTWGPLIRDTTIQNGTIEICPGSDREGIAPQTWNEEAGRATQIIVKPEIVAKYTPCPVEMKLGQLLIFSGKLFHRSGQNTSSEIRYSLVGMYHSTAYPDFRPASIAFNYKGLTPKEYFEQCQL